MAVLWRVGPGALLAVIETGKDCALGEAVANIGAKINQDTGNGGSNLRCDARFGGSKAKDLNRYVVLSP